MKLAFLHLYLATESGDPRMVLSIAKECKAQGHEVKIYCAEFNPAFLSELHKGMEVVVVPPSQPLASVRGASSVWGRITERVRRDALYRESARRIGEKLDPDFDFVFAENDPTYLAATEYKKIHPNAKAVWIMNNPPFYHSHKANVLANIASKALAWYESVRMKRFAKQIDWAVVYDAQYKKEAESLGYTVKLIGNPVDYDYFYMPPRTIASGAPIRLLAVGALSPQRRFEDAITATAILKKAGYNVRLTIVCKDYWSDKEYRTRFEDFIQASGVGDVIDAKFDGVQEGEMMQLLRESHVSLAPNCARVWIVTSCEAMAAGLPVVVSRATAMADIFHDGSNALFFDAFDAKELARQVGRLIDDQVLYVNVATAGQRYVKEHLSFPEFVKEVMRPE